MLFSEDGTNQATHGWSVREDAHDIGATSDLLVETLQGLLDQIFFQWGTGKLDVTIYPGHLLMGGSPRWAYCRTSGRSRKSFAGIGLDPFYQIRGGEAVQFEDTVYIIFRVHDSYLSSHTPNSTNHPFGGYSWARTPPRSAGACTRVPSRVRY